MTDEEISGVLAAENEEFKALQDEHKGLKKKLEEFKLKARLTPEEEMEKKKMQKLKLARKDQMAGMVRAYKEAHPA